MVLSIKDRLNLSSLFPNTGDLVTQLLVKDIREKISLSQEEMDATGFKVVNESYQWDNELEEDKDIKFSKAEWRFLKDQVERLDKEKKITQNLVDICVAIKKVEIDKEKKEDKPE